MVEPHLQKFSKRTPHPPSLRLVLTLSIVLMAATDAKYKFTWVDIGDYGSMSDGGIWAESALGSALEEGSVDLPLSCLLPNSNIMFPHFFCGGRSLSIEDTHDAAISKERFM
ncbi:nuclease harbi1 [Lasius niger]|uniref:Nuclease harbi1 n=1 Tax=Lasius niger TaxID=67767 RepID=A0A0J7K5W7_LASNI|nr:nuclease harbi1 [Lasius niger]